MRKRVSKLSLSRETIRNISAGSARGGQGLDTQSCNTGCHSHCPPYGCNTTDTTTYGGTDTNGIICSLASQCETGPIRI